MSWIMAKPNAGARPERRTTVGGQYHPDDCSVFAVIALFDFVVIALALERFSDVQVFLQQVSIERELPKAPADQFAPFIAEDFLKYEIRKQQAALQVADGDAHASVFVNRPEPFLALSEHLFRAVAFGDVLAMPTQRPSSR